MDIVIPVKDIIFRNKLFWQWKAINDFKFYRYFNFKFKLQGSLETGLYFSCNDLFPFL